VYEKLDLNANYTIIISNYLSEGGDGFSFKKVLNYQSFGECETNILFKKKKCCHYYYNLLCVLIKSGKTDLNIVEEQFQARSPVWPEVSQRIVLLSVEEMNKVQTTSTNNQFVFTPLSDLTLLLLAIVIMLYLPDQGLANGGVMRVM